MKIKLFLLVMLGLVSGALLVGCGKSEEQPPGPSTTNAPAPPAPAK
jgi:hypothetical protein